MQTLGNSVAFIVHMPFQVAEKGAETKGPSFVPTICIKGDRLATSRRVWRLERKKDYGLGKWRNQGLFSGEVREKTMDGNAGIGAGQPVQKTRSWLAGAE